MFLNYTLKGIIIRNIWSVNISESFDEISHEFYFFLTGFHNDMSFVLNEYFIDNYVDYEWSVIGGESKFWKYIVVI